MPVVDPVYTGKPLGVPANIAGYIGTPLEKLCWNCPAQERRWRNWLLQPTLEHYWTWMLIHMKSMWNHIFVTSHEICLNYIKILLTSYERLMRFTRTSREFHMEWNGIHWYEIHEKFNWTSYGVQLNLSWISYEMKSNLLIWIYMQFIWSSYELHIEGLMKLICYTHVILMKLTWGS